MRSSYRKAMRELVRMFKPLEFRADGSWSFFPLRLLAPILLPLALAIWAILCVAVMARRAWIWIGSRNAK